jgi:hypothetical protein
MRLDKISLQNHNSLRIYLDRKEVKINDKFFGRNIYTTDSDGLPAKYYADIDLDSFILNPLVGDGKLLENIMSDTTIAGASMVTWLREFNGNCFRDENLSFVFKTKSSDGTFCYGVWGKNPKDVLTFILHNIGVAVDEMPQWLKGYEQYAVPAKVEVEDKISKKNGAVQFAFEFLGALKDIANDVWKKVLDECNEREAWKSGVCSH